MAAKRRAHDEDQIQAAVVLHLTIRATPGIVWWHTPNGGLRNVGEARRLKTLGVKAGVPDLLAVREGRLFAVELKAPGGRVSDAQREMLAALEAAGVATAVAYGLDEALATLESWCLLRPSAANSARRVRAAG